MSRRTRISYNCIVLQTVMYVNIINIFSLSRKRHFATDPTGPLTEFDKQV